MLFHAAKHDRRDTEVESSKNEDDELEQELAVLAFRLETEAHIEIDNRPLFVRHCEYLYKVVDGTQPNRYSMLI